MTAPALVYCCASDSEQKVFPSTLPDQSRSCLDWLSAHPEFDLLPETNYDCPGVFADPAVSEWKMSPFRRPGFLSLWGHLPQGGAIIVRSLDRLARYFSDMNDTWIRLSSAGVRLIAVSDEIDSMESSALPSGEDFISAVSRGISRSAWMHSLHSKMNVIRKMVKSKGEGECDDEDEEDDGIASRAQSVLFSVPPFGHSSSSDFIDSVSSVRTSDLVRVPGRVFGYVADSPLLPDNRGLVTEAIRGIALSGYEPQWDLFEDREPDDSDGTEAFRVLVSKRKAARPMLDILRPGDCVVLSSFWRLFLRRSDHYRVFPELLRKGISFVSGCGVDTRTRSGLDLAAIDAATRKWGQACQARLNRAPWYLDRLEHGHNTRESWGYHIYQDWLDCRTGEKVLGRNVDLIQSLLWVFELSDFGLSQRRIARILEEFWSKRQGRSVAPDMNFSPEWYVRRLITTCAGRKLISRSARWARERRRLAKIRGRKLISREWTRERVYHTLKRRKEIEEEIRKIYRDGASSFREEKVKFSRDEYMRPLRSFIPDFSAPPQNPLFSAVGSLQTS